MLNSATQPQPASTPYDSQFYCAQADGSLRSARVIAPLLLERLRVHSVVDVGCGIGTWLRAFEELGIRKLAGFDGDYVDRSKFQVDEEFFRPADLQKPLPLECRYDLALCLEVGEHLPEASAATLVESLTRAADVVLFSAAIPGQGGTHHINEQWPRFWFDLFNARDYVARDWVRPLVWDNSDVEWWYAQNMIVYMTREAAEVYSGIPKHSNDDSAPLALVHPKMFTLITSRLSRSPGLRERTRGLGSAVRAAVARRLGSSSTRS